MINHSSRATRLLVTCEMVELWITDHHGQPLPPSIHRHFQACSECREEYEDALPLERLMGGSRLGGGLPGREADHPTGGVLSRSEGDPLFLRAVMAGVRAELPPIRGREVRRRRWIRAAAGLVVGVGILFLNVPTGSKEKAGEATAVRSPANDGRAFIVVDERAAEFVGSEFIPAFTLEGGPEIVSF